MVVLLNAPYTHCCPVWMSFPDAHLQVLGSSLHCWLSRFILSSLIFALLQVCSNSSKLPSKIS